MSINLFSWNEYPIKSNKFLFLIVLWKESDEDKKNNLKENVKKNLLKVFPNNIIHTIPNSVHKITGKTTLLLNDNHKFTHDDILNIEACYVHNKPLKILYFIDSFKNLDKTVLTLSNILFFNDKDECNEYLKERSFFSINLVDNNLFVVIDKRVVKGDNIKFLKKDNLL